MTERNKALQNRIEKFVIDSITLVNNLPKSSGNLRIGPQLIDSAGSVGSNYLEACEADSSKDFVHKIKIAKKEAREANYWLRMLRRTNTELHEDLDRLARETDELVRIFSSIVLKFRN